MSSLLELYADVVGQDVIDQLRTLARPLAGLKVVHVNSTRVGGGVAEILTKLVPFMQELGLETSWEVITGDEPFFACTKHFHNALQGFTVMPDEIQLRAYERVPGCRRSMASFRRFKRCCPHLEARASV